MSNMLLLYIGNKCNDYYYKFKFISDEEYYFRVHFFDNPETAIDFLSKNWNAIQAIIIDESIALILFRNTIFYDFLLKEYPIIPVAVLTETLETKNTALFNETVFYGSNEILTVNEMIEILQKSRSLANVNGIVEKFKRLYYNVWPGTEDTFKSEFFEWFIIETNPVIARREAISCIKRKWQNGSKNVMDTLYTLKDNVATDHVYKIASENIERRISIINRHLEYLYYEYYNFILGDETEEITLCDGKLKLRLMKAI